MGPGPIDLDRLYRNIHTKQSREKNQDPLFPIVPAQFPVPVLVRLQCEKATSPFVLLSFGLLFLFSSDLIKCFLLFSGLVIDVDDLQETSFVHSQQIDSLQNANVLLDQRVTVLESSIPSNNTGSRI